MNASDFNMNVISKSTQYWVVSACSSFVTIFARSALGQKHESMYNYSFIFLCHLFHSAVSISDNIALNDKMISE
jgi:hypothetical protein